MYPYFLFAAFHHLKSSPTFSVRPCSSVGRVTVDLIRRSWVRFPPRSKDFFFASCGSLFPFTRANAQWVIHGTKIYFVSLPWSRSLQDSTIVLSDLIYCPPRIAELMAPSSGLLYILQPNLYLGSPVFSVTQVLPLYNQPLCLCVYTHCLYFGLGVISYVSKDSSFASLHPRHFLAWRGPKSNSLNVQKKREPHQVNCSLILRSYEEYGNNQTLLTEKKRLYCSLALKEVY